MIKPDQATLKKLRALKGSIFINNVLTDSDQPVPQKVLDTFDYLVDKGELKFFYRFYMEDDPGKYVDFDSLDDVPFDDEVIYPPTGETMFIPRYGEPEKFYYFTSDEKYVKDKMEIHAEEI